MLDEIKVIDNFCPLYQGHIKKAYHPYYGDHEYEPGVTYPGISKELEADWAYRKFGIKFKPVLDFARMYTKGMKQPTFIHEDSSISEYSAILCLGNSLDRDYGSVVFWEPKKLGANTYRETEWTAIKEVKLIPNRCVVFPAKMWHSRYPKDWKEDYPRFVQVFFFNSDEYVRLQNKTRG